MMCEEEKEALLERATGAIIESWDQPIMIELDKRTLSCIIGQLQLAFRHPQNRGKSRQLAERFAHSVIESLDPAHGDVYQVMMVGFEEIKELEAVQG